MPYRRLSRVSAALALLLSCAGAQAHHSRAHFLLDEKIEIEGTVTELSWRSPHIYMEVEALDADGRAQSWTLEGHSIPGSLSVGWKQDSVKAGDRVLVVAHPNRDSSKTFAMLYSATLTDGRTFYAYSIPAGVDVEGVESRRPTAPSQDFSGTWRYPVPVRVATIESYRAPTEWPLTPLGRAQAEQFDINDDPQLDCVPMGVPRLILSTYSHRWRRFADRIEIEKERTPQLRRIYLDGRAMPAAFEPNELGFSIGHFEDDGTLVVETRGFAPTPWGNSRGLDSSAQKRVVERYRLGADGYTMSVSYTIDDPVYLTEPVTVTGEYQKSSDFAFVPETCDAETARRHLRY
jgi:hypothetical protein